MVDVPKNWVLSVSGVRTLFFWGEGAWRGKPFPSYQLAEITSLSNLETIMVLGYAFNDNDAHELSKSKSLKRIILRGTAVTPKGEAELLESLPGSRVFRN